jgi:hypothetical protein
VVASSLPVFVALNAAIGAPASELAPRGSFWWKLEPRASLCLDTSRSMPAIDAHA